MTAANPSHALALTFVDEIARCGVRHVCLAPGSRSAALALAFAHDDRIRVHVSIDERSASFMALGIGRATGTPAALLSTSGTAAANFHPAVIEADAARVPLLAITADRPPELRATGANQTIDQIKLYGDSVRWFCEVGVPEARPDAPAYWRSVVSRAYSEAVGGPPGPVHLNLAMREPLVPQGEGFPHDLSGRSDGAPWTRVSQQARGPGEDDVALLAEAIASTERGVVVAGEGAHDVLALQHFAERVGYPLFAEPLSNARWGPNVITTYDALLRTNWAQNHRPELVIRFGRVATSKVLSQALGHDVRQVLIDPDRWWLDPGRAMSWMIAAAVGETLRRVSERIDPRGSSRWMSEWRAAEEKARGALDTTLDAEEPPSEPRAARDLVALIPGGSNLVVASSMPVRDLDWFMEARDDVRIFGNRGASGIDGFVSTALGIALATGAPTFALAGDLSMLHDQNGLIGARERGTDVTFVVLNNDGGGIFSFLPQARFSDNFEELFGTPHGIDFEAFARVYGVEYERLERASDLSGALSGAGVRIVEIRTDRTANVELHRRVWDAVGAALEM